MEICLLISGDNQANLMSEEKPQYHGFASARALSTKAKSSHYPEKFLSVQEILLNWAAEKKSYDDVLPGF